MLPLAKRPIGVPEISNKLVKYISNSFNDIFIIGTYNEQYHEIIIIIGRNVIINNCSLKNDENVIG